MTEPDRSTVSGFDNRVQCQRNANALFAEGSTGVTKLQLPKDEVHGDGVRASL